MKTICQIFGLTCIVSIASAQTAPIRAGSFELGGFVGSTYNVSQGAIMGGANLSYAVTKIFLPYIEYSYFPSIGRTGTGTVYENDCGATKDQACTFSTNYTTHAIDFHGGVHIRIPIRETRFAPYGVFGIGTLGVGSGTITGYQATDHASPTVPVAVTIAPARIPGTSSLAINFGGGLRYYVTPSYGFRIEVKGYKPVNNQQPTNTVFQSISITNTFLKAEVGFFYQFR